MSPAVRRLLSTASCYGLNAGPPSPLPFIRLKPNSQPYGLRPLGGAFGKLLGEQRAETGEWD